MRMLHFEKTTKKQVSSHQQRLLIPNTSTLFTYLSKAISQKLVQPMLHIFKIRSSKIFNFKKIPPHLLFKR
jgi:hypothetical protein